MLEILEVEFSVDDFFDGSGGKRQTVMPHHRHKAQTANSVDNVTRSATFGMHEL